MFWTLPRYRAGDFVEVRSKEEILATLDARGCVEGLPFMPEMFQFCGRRFRVRAVAHKTCETARQTWRSRRLRASVHLEDLRCDGESHGGCQAACTLFWKDVWLKPTGADNDHNVPKELPPSFVCSDSLLIAHTQSESADGEPCYACQATKLYDATEPLAWWDIRQYVLDVVTRNYSLGRVLGVLWLSWLRDLQWGVQHVPLLRRVYAGFNEWMHRRLTGRGVPFRFKDAKPCSKTPTGRLNLKAGEMVRIKSQSEIETTLDAQGLNRGLSFDADEMAPYCGGTYRVRSSVTQIIDEMTGKMRTMKQPCIILEGVVCRSEYAWCRLNCPRAIPSYWRELWLERVEVMPSNGAPAPDHSVAAVAERLG